MRWRPFFRNYSMFRQSNAPQDPEDIKLRFRRWVVIASFLIVLLILAVPVFRFRGPAFAALSNARALVRLIIDVRQGAGHNRKEAGILLVGTDHWEQFTLKDGSDCVLKGKRLKPKRSIHQEATAWRALFLPEYASDGIGRDVQFVCFHPQHGVVADGEPIADGWLYLLVSPKEDVEDKRMERSYQIILSQHGDKLEIRSVL